MSSVCVWPFGVILIVVGRVGGGGRGVLPFFALGEGRRVVGVLNTQQYTSHTIPPVARHS